MVGHDLAILVTHHAILLLLAADCHKFKRVKQIGLVDKLSAVLDGIDCCLIDHIGKIGTHQTCRRKCQCIQIHGLIHHDVLGMYLECLQTPLQIRLVDNDPAVKTSRTEQRLVQYLRTVGCSENQNSLGRVKTVHLRKELVQCLLSLIVAAVTGVTALTDRIDLIDKDDTRCLLLRFLKQIPHTGSSDTDEHLHKIRTCQREKRYLRLARHCLGKERLTGSRRSHKKRTLRQLRTDVAVLFRVVQEIDNLL